MKRVLLLFILCFMTVELSAQKVLRNFSETITINGEEYLLADAPSYLDYRLIAKKDAVKSLYGKYPFYGIVDRDKNIVIPCNYLSLIPLVDKGVIFAQYGDNLISSKLAILNFRGNTIESKIGLGTVADPLKKAYAAYDKLPQATKDDCIDIYQNISNQFLAAYGNVNSNNNVNVNVTPSQNSSSQFANNNPKPNSDVDINIPITNKKADNTFVLVIANENYEFVDDVQFALNDGETFREYCIKTLGVPERQVWLYKDATAGIIAGGVDKMLQAMSIFDNCNVIVYYCGHGIPDESTGDAYIIPTDGKGTNTATCYSLNKLYKTLASAKAKSVTYFMDACFSGANRDGSMLVAARGVAREAKKEVISGNTIVFSAASGDETAMPYKEKQHGLFTYFLLKKLQESKGDVTYGELAEYIKTNVQKEAFLTNEKPQNPVVATSATSAVTWKSYKF